MVTMQTGPAVRTTHWDSQPRRHCLTTIVSMHVLSHTERRMLPADTINAIMGAFGNGFTAFVFPAAYHMWVYRTPEARAACLKPPPRFAQSSL